jgi:hypothetical protein
MVVIWWTNTWLEKTEVFCVKPAPVPLCLPQIPHERSPQHYYVDILNAEHFA